MGWRPEGGGTKPLRVDGEAGLSRLPFFTQRTAVLLLGVLVATLAMLGGVVALVGWPGAGWTTWRRECCRQRAATPRQLAQRANA